MNDLAHNVNGEPFELPNAATSWRVRRLKAKGAPEVVYGTDGVPLVLPIEADMDDLRREAMLPGRYRLDPIDQHGKVVENVSAGYVYVHPTDVRSGGTVEPHERVRVPTGATSEHTVVMEALRNAAEMARMHADVARSIAEQIAPITNAVANLLRAADGAGLPSREPRGLAYDPQAQDTDDDAAPPPAASAPAASPSAWTAAIQAFAPFVGPSLADAIASGKLAIPGGLGAMFDCRRAVRPDATQDAPRATTARSAAPTSTATPSGARSNPMVSTAPTVPLGHVMAVYAALTPTEAQLARALVAELTPAERDAWLAELGALAVPDAVARVRAIMGAPAPVASSPTLASAGAS